MGDRCSVSIQIYGRAPRDKLLAAVEEEDPTHSDPVRGFWEFDECNYGAIDAVTSVCHEHELPYEMWHGAGYEYPAGVIYFDGRRIYEYGDGMVPIDISPLDLAQARWLHNNFRANQPKFELV